MSDFAQVEWLSQGACNLYVPGGMWAIMGRSSTDWGVTWIPDGADIFDCPAEPDRFGSVNDAIAYCRGRL